MHELKVLQEIRKSHCARERNGHNCVGTCTITPEGLFLKCEVCGEGDERTLPHSYSEMYRRAKAILSAAGMSFNALSADIQVEVIREIQRDHCPGCNKLRTYSKYYDYTLYYKCSCGKYDHYDSNGWKKSGE